MVLTRLPMIAALVLTASACSMFGGAENAKLRKSPTYQQGYEDGCASANQQGADLRDRQVQDPTLYKSDQAYREGWSSGASLCRTTNTAPGAQPDGNPLGGPLPGMH
jgi:hypothetical protein